MTWLSASSTRSVSDNEKKESNMKDYHEFVISWFDGKRDQINSFWNASEYMEFLRFLKTNEIEVLGGA